MSYVIQSQTHELPHEMTSTTFELPGCTVVRSLGVVRGVVVRSRSVIGTFGAFTIPYLLGPAQPMMMGVSMQQTFNNYMDRTGALTQAVLTFGFCAAVGVIYVRTVTRSPEGRP